MAEPGASERLIVALDVPSRDEALRLVDDLGGLVSFFKVGWELFLSGAAWEVIERLVPDRKVFLDLKLPDDVPETIRRAVARPAGLGVRFLTIGAHLPATIAAAAGARGASEYPKLLAVPLISSAGGADLRAAYGDGAPDVQAYVAGRAAVLLGAGCDGLIASGEAIRRLRGLHPMTLIVSPGIRPSGLPADDHERSATPAEAVAMGADYLVVGRPIKRAAGREARRKVASVIIEEIAAAFEARRAGSRTPEP